MIQTKDFMYQIFLEEKTKHSLVFINVYWFAEDWGGKSFDTDLRHRGWGSDPHWRVPHKVTTSQREMDIKVSCQRKFHPERIRGIFFPPPRDRKWYFLLFSCFSVTSIVHLRERRDVRVITQLENCVKQGDSFLNTGKSKNLSHTQNLECLTLWRNWRFYLK